MESGLGNMYYLQRYGDLQVPCTPYTLKKLGFEQGLCLLKVDDYNLMIAPFQLGFKRSVFMGSLSKQEILFFQKYTNSIAGLSLGFSVPTRKEPLLFFIRCTILSITPMKGRDTVALFTLDYKNSPDEYIGILGAYLEGQDQLKQLYESYGKEEIRFTPEVARIMGYNLYATIKDTSGQEGRIQIFSLNSKTMVHLEGPHVQERVPGSKVVFQLYFKKYRCTLSGTIQASSRLSSGILRTTSTLDFSPQLIEILDDYYFTVRARSLNQSSSQGIPTVSS
ncbi:MAG: hypothetical protein N2Z76_08200 [Treponemataceae bacterium]|nr:hypothetical protein [Treponemataceae bacterium]